jgi:hypothetical protein
VATATVPAHHEPTDQQAASHAVAEELRSWFGTDFRLFGADAKAPRDFNLNEQWDDNAITRQIACRSWHEDPQLLPQLGPLLRLELPIHFDGDQRSLAIGTFVRRRVSDDENVDDASIWLGTSDADTAAWINAQPLWTADSLLRCGRLALDKLAADQKSRQHEREADDVTQNLVATYEEITFLYQVTERLARADSVESLLDYLLQSLVELLPAQAVMCRILPPDNGNDAADEQPQAPTLLMRGQCPLDGDQLQRFIREVAAPVQGKPYVFNCDEDTDADRWTFPEVNQLIVVPLSAGGCVFGWIAAMNHGGGQWFGTVQARLLQCVATVLGTLSNNVRLSAQQQKLESEKRAAESQAQQLGEELGQLCNRLSWLARK